MKRLFAFVCLLIVVGCDLFERNHYSEGTFPATVANLGDINSAEDDYNSAGHFVGNDLSLIFSSKRGGRSDFNLVDGSFGASFDLHNGKISFNSYPYTVGDGQSTLIWATEAANSSANELGPYLRSYEQDLIPANAPHQYDHYEEYLMFFASDRTGDLDIYLTHNYQDSVKSADGLPIPESSKQFRSPVPISFLNSSADDAYPTFDQTYHSIYFTSNRGGSFDIYRATIPDMPRTELQTRLPALANVAIERVSGLSSSADDKCPFINGNTLVFTSNRPGGYGGYDLYYSTWDGTNWSAAVNFGPTINTSYDEYRPVLFNMQQFSNQLMIFSSNRPGGKGGFDLYRVGVPK